MSISAGFDPWMTLDETSEHFSMFAFCGYNFDKFDAWLCDKSQDGEEKMCMVAASRLLLKGNQILLPLCFASLLSLIVCLSEQGPSRTFDVCYSVRANLVSHPLICYSEQG